MQEPTMQELTSPRRPRHFPAVALGVFVAAGLGAVAASQADNGVAVVAEAPTTAVSDEAAIPPDGYYAYIPSGGPGDDASDRVIAEDDEARARKLGYNARAIHDPGFDGHCSSKPPLAPCADGGGPGGYLVVLDGPFADAPPPSWAPNAVPPEQSIGWHEAKKAEVEGLARARGLPERVELSYLEFSLLKGWTPPAPG